jgi:uncharacterized protein with GYD domain
MPHYLIRGSHTPETWARLIQNPENRREAVGRLLEANGGKLEAFYYAFGEEDFYVICELPDNVSSAAVAMAVAGSGAFKSFSTTVLMTPEEVIEALGKAKNAGYRAPGAR